MMEHAAKNDGLPPTIVQVCLKFYNHALDYYVYDLGVSALKYIGSQTNLRESLLLAHPQIDQHASL